MEFSRLVDRMFRSCFCIAAETEWSMLLLTSVHEYGSTAVFSRCTFSYPIPVSKCDRGMCIYIPQARKQGLFPIPEKICRETG